MGKRPGDATLHVTARYTHDREAAACGACGARLVDARARDAKGATLICPSCYALVEFSA